MMEKEALGNGGSSLLFNKHVKIFTYQSQQTLSARHLFTYVIIFYHDNLKLDILSEFATAIEFSW